MNDIQEPQIVYVSTNFYKESVKRAVYKYRLANPEKYKGDQRVHRATYYEKNKEKILQKAKEARLKKKALANLANELN